MPANLPGGRLSALASAVLLSISIWALVPSAEERAQCAARGAVDSPGATVTMSAPTFQVTGWVHDWMGVKEVQAVVGGRVVAATRPEIVRPDVTAALAACPEVSRPGFVLSVPFGPMPDGGKQFEIRGTSSFGRSFPIGQVTARFDRPIGHVDSAGPIRWDGATAVSGWAFAREGMTSVRVLAGERELARVEADRLRQDVQRVFSDWPQAGRSGFEIRLSMSDLPRGRYPLKLSLESDDGTFAEMDGPEVWNDEPLGKVRAAADRLANPDTVALDAWILAEPGVEEATVETEDGIRLARMRKVREGVSLADFEGSKGKASNPARLGSVFRAHIPKEALPSGLHRLVVKASDKARRSAALPGPLVRRGTLSDEPCPGRPRRLYYPGNFKAFRDDFPAMQSWRRLIGGGCLEVGVRGRVEYMRTTRGRQHDYLFDPDFPDAGRVRNGREMTGVSLRNLLDLARRLQAPLLVTLDGGVWADMSFSDPEIDVVDMLEEDERTVQWNQHGYAEADDALSNLPGSLDSPQLARMMSLNRFNARFREYKKRNLQAAVREIVKFSRTHPHIDVKINLDPDLYINPWFHASQWYDYNPDTLRQFREWLFHLGPYADGGSLSKTRREPKISLQEAGRLAGKEFDSIEEVDPPRGPLDYGDAWQQIWSHFRRHLVSQHYEDLANWAAEAGMPVSGIYTAQTFIEANVAVGVNARADNWTDQAGVSIEGAKPTQGHLGTILYGPASRNAGIPRSGRSLIDNIRSIDPEWGVVEFHPATIAEPDRLPTHEDSYQTLLTLTNGGARFMSPMWGSRAVDQRLNHTAFRAYDSMEGSPFEFQLAWWMLKLHRVTAGSLFFPFGNEFTASHDGWRTGAGTSLKTNPGVLRLGGTMVTLVSPEWDGLETGRRMTLDVIGNWPGRTLRVEIMLKNKSSLQCGTIVDSPMRCQWDLDDGDRVTQIRLTWPSKTDTPLDVVLDEISLAVNVK